MKITDLVNRYSNLRVYSTLMILLFSISGFSQTDKWVGFDTAFSDYITNPTHENSVKVYELLPNELNSGDFPKGKISDRIWLSAVKLEEMIVAGNRDALRLGFKLFTIADGEFAEGLDITIGKLINKNPSLFLQELKNQRQFLHDIGGLVCNYGPDFVDNAKLSLTETNNRIKSLMKITDSVLFKERDECLAELERHKKTLEMILKEK